MLIELAVSKIFILDMEASEPKWVNPVLDTIGVNPLGLEDLHISFRKIKPI